MDITLLSLIAIMVAILLGLVIYLVFSISKQKDTNSAAAQSGVTMASLAALCPRPMFNVSKKGIIQYANLASNDLLGEWERHIGERVPQQLLEVITSTDENLESQIITHKTKDNIYSILITPIDGGNSFNVYAQDMTREKRAEEDLVKSTIYDLDTDLPNRSLFYDYLKIEMGHIKGEYKVFILAIDLKDYLDILNSYGEDIAVKVLNATKIRLLNLLSDDVTLARVGERKFGVIESIYYDASQVEALCRKIISQFKIPLLIEGNEIISRVSIGISSFPDDADTHDALLRNANLALHRAEQSPFGYSFYQLDKDEKKLKEHELLVDLHKAIEENEFEVYYQPQFRSVDQKLVGAEALIRWKHPVRGYVSPFLFMSVAEESGLIVQLGAWIIDRVCLDLATWKRAGHETTIAINLSAVQFMDDKLVDIIKTALEIYNVDRSSVEFEITESVVIGNVEDTLQKMQELRENHFKLAIDDFGTGYSSLSYLQRFPVQKLKIDKAFVDDIVDSAPSYAMIKGIIELGHSLGLKIVAEGVETKEQFDKLKDLNCEIIQGYYFSKPINAKDFAKYFEPKDFEPKDFEPKD